jgi:ribosomal protein L11 methyltransferase
VEFAIYGTPGEVPELGEFQAVAGDGVVDVTTTSVPDDWADRWADFHRPIEVSGRMRVRPSWWDREEGLMDVVIDPGRAFGTGGHATTRLSLAFLIELEEAGEARGPLADWGTGSGVLAIAAAKLGFEPVIGCDREPASLETAAENAEANGVELELERVDIREQAPPVGPAVVANLTANLLRDCAAHLARADRLPDTLICSGMLESEIDGVAAAFGDVDLTAVRRLAEGEWGALLLRGEPSP